jgi:hypothetical protein
MMRDDADIWRLAALLVRRYGNEASPEAERRRQAAKRAGDDEGRATWQEAATALLEFTRQPSSGDLVN